MVSQLTTESKKLWLPVFFMSWLTYFIGGSLLLYFLENNKQCYINPMTWSKRDLCQHIIHSARDLCCVLPLMIWGTSYFLSVVNNVGNLNNEILISDDNLISFCLNPLKVAMVPVSLFVSSLFRMFLHRLLHRKPFYKWVHKFHHLHPTKMTPFSTYYDTIAEFVSMEAFGMY